MDDKEQNQVFNQQESEKLKENPIYQKYLQWLAANGVIVDPHVVYPAYFGAKGKGVIGVATAKPISAHSAVLAVPYKLIITVEKVKQQPLLLEIIKENPNIFKINDDSSFAILALYVCFELMKQQKSFYYPYFAIANDISLTNWTHWDRLAIENSDVARLMKQQQEEVEIYFLKFLSVFRRYPEVFPASITNSEYQKIFEKSYNFICTRAFGWSLPSISLIPMADSLNHNNDYVTHMLIDIQNEMSPHQNYEQKHKKYDLSILSSVWKQMPQCEVKKSKQTRVKKFVRKHKQIVGSSKPKDPQHYILWQQYKAGIHNLRQLNFYDESCEEDNDTDEQTIESQEFNLEKYKFYEKYENPGLGDKNKKQGLIKYWKLYLDPVFQDAISESDEETGAKKQIAEVKEAFAKSAKESEGSSLVSSSSSSDSDDEEFKWMAGHPESHSIDTTYFIMATRHSIKKNEQLFNFYGRRSNRFLLVGYNFVLDDNKYDSYAFRIYVDNWTGNNKNPFAIKQPSLNKIICRGGEKSSNFYTREIRLKMQRVNIELINHCRALLIGWTDKIETYGAAMVTIPFSVEFQKKVLGLALNLITILRKEYMTDSEEDEQLLQKCHKHEMAMAIKMRMKYKSILDEQVILINKCLHYLALWKNGKVSIAEPGEMAWVGRVRQYLQSLERSKL